MGQPAKKIIQQPLGSKSSNDNSNMIEKIKARRSNEIVIGLCGAVGSGVKKLKNILVPEFEKIEYKVEHIRLSELIFESCNKNSLLSLDDLHGYERYEILQNYGDELRSEYDKSFVAQLAINKINILRTESIKKEDKGLKNVGDDDILKTDEKVVYIIDQFKNPDEIILFKEIYSDAFYLIGLLRNENQRKQNLKDERISEENIAKLMIRDKKSKKYGQNTEETILQSDYFIKNVDNNDILRKDVRRFIDLMHGANNVTPTYDEIGMHNAYSASFGSACLSRQVGAAIMDDDGNILSTGCNDVPKFGGGLYHSNDQNDMRCFNRGKCFNDTHKGYLKKEIDSILDNSLNKFLSIINSAIDEYASFINEKIDGMLTCDVKEMPSDKRNDSIKSFIGVTQKKELKNDVETIKNLKEYFLGESGKLKISDIIMEDTKAKSLIEYSRAVHAEMDALLALARTTSSSTLNKTLYCTTYPCHNCARHIIAAGIKRVVYIEPYEKSLAIQLHNDAISLHQDDIINNKVSFQHYDGVSPKRYDDFFKYRHKRKNSDGTVKTIHSMDVPHVSQVHLDSYVEYELKIVSELTKKEKG
ncbi:anti-phage dCTP deaminase [Proteus vulgaris]|uniref:anti-phage dCTP deaminase n=1 Tax=Proteus vulgaris TaxID=585 RepID=UPI0028893D6D|nr:anti-phage dCTP deaminase [Proteus vulgaris]